MAGSVAIVLIPHASAWNFARLDPRVPKTGNSSPPHKRRVDCFRFKKRNFARNSAEYSSFRSCCTARCVQPATIVQRHGGGQLGGLLGNQQCKISGGHGHDHHGHDHHDRDHGHGDNPDHGRGPTDGHVPSVRAPLPSSPRRSADRHDAARPRPRLRTVGGSNSPRATCNGFPLDTSNPAPRPILGRERAAAPRPPAGGAAVQFSRQWRCRRRKLHRRSA